jgi:hypothetical protein
MDKSLKVARPELEEHDLGQSAKKIIAAPLRLASKNGRSVKPEALVLGKYVLKHEVTYLVTCDTDCYIAIGGANIIANNTDVKLLAKTVHLINTEKNPEWTHMAISGTAQVVELA